MALTRALSAIALVVALLTSACLYLDSRLESFYIFTPEQLHKVSLRAIDAHGNDTRAIVNQIVTDLRETDSASYLNLDEEWIFNNAGGAMGGMYIIHASELLSLDAVGRDVTDGDGPLLEATVG